VIYGAPSNLRKSSPQFSASPPKDDRAQHPLQPRQSHHEIRNQLRSSKPSPPPSPKLRELYHTYRKESASVIELFSSQRPPFPACHFDGMKPGGTSLLFLFLLRNRRVHGGRIFSLFFRFQRNSGLSDKIVTMLNETPIRHSSRKTKTQARLVAIASPAGSVDHPLSPLCSARNSRVQSSASPCRLWISVACPNCKATAGPASMLFLDEVLTPHARRAASEISALRRQFDCQFEGRVSAPSERLPQRPHSLACTKLQQRRNKNSRRYCAWARNRSGKSLAIRTLRAIRRADFANRWQILRALDETTIPSLFSRGLTAGTLS